MLLLLSLITLSFAEERNVSYNKRTEIDFEALDVSGELVKPQGSIIIERVTTKFPPVMKPRLDFNSEMTLSVNEIK